MIDFSFVYPSEASWLNYEFPSWESDTDENLLSSCRKCLRLTMMTMLFVSASLDVKEMTISSWQREKMNLWYRLTSGPIRRPYCVHRPSVRTRGQWESYALRWNCPCCPPRVCVCVCVCVFAVRVVTHPPCILHLLLCFILFSYKGRK